MAADSRTVTIFRTDGVALIAIEAADQRDAIIKLAGQGADLYGADLTGADLTGALGVSVARSTPMAMLRDQVGAIRAYVPRASGRGSR